MLCFRYFPLFLVFVLGVHLFSHLCPKEQEIAKDIFLGYGYERPLHLLPWDMHEMGGMEVAPMIVLKLVSLNLKWLSLWTE